MISPPELALVAGIGASAGGVEALHELLGAVPHDSPIGFIVHLHMDSGSTELLSDTLSKFTPMPVVEAVNGVRIKAGHIYVIPGHFIPALKDGEFKLTAARKDEQRCPIDTFFCALARDQGERCVAVVLSGNGNDGALGLKEVSKAGGMTLVQAPATTKHPEMPQSAIDMGAADHVLAPASITEELLAYAEHMRTSGRKQKFEELHAQVDNLLPGICERLLAVTGHNFRHYKSSTLSRRIHRRIQVLRIGSVQEYLRRLEADEVEVRHLFNDLLIGVTAFFRDPEAFDLLAREVLPPLFKDRTESDVIRIWVPGCSTGEEAYTIAMLLREQLDKQEHKPELQIFATDIDSESLHFARRGIYPHTITQEISPERLRRYFIKKAQHYHVGKEIRGMVLFSLHNLINDPPFSKLDMISCRNLLIYLGSHLQKKLIPLFHYALKPGGYLFLGPSENISSHRELFKAVNAKNRISQRLPTAVHTATILQGRSGVPASSFVRPPNVPAATDTDTYLLMQRTILDEFAPKGLVVDEDGQIICASGNLEKYISVSAGAFHNKAMRLVKESLRVGLRTALSEATRLRRQISQEGLVLRVPEGIQRVMLTVQPMPQMGDEAGLFLVVFQDVGLPHKEEVTEHLPSEKVGLLIEQLERELLSAREDLERGMQDLEAVNEEMKSSNEELLSMNEELQSGNEELETSKEALQAANDTLNLINTDLENLLASTRIGTLFLDDEGRVRWVTPHVAEIYNILPTDTGRLLSHFTHKARFMPDLPPVAEIHNAARPIEDEIEMQDGTWFIRRVVPYQTQAGEAEGIVVMFTEITERKQSELALSKSEEKLRLAMSASRSGVWQWDPVTDITTLSPRAAEIIGIAPAESMSRTQMRDNIVHKDYREATFAALESALENKADYSIEYPIHKPSGELAWIQAVGAGDYDINGRITGMTGVLKDITESKLAEERLIHSEQLYRGIGESIDYGIWVCDAGGRNIYASDSFLKLVGLTQKECSAFGWSELLHPDDVEDTVAAWKKCVEEGGLWDREHRFKGADKQWHSILARGVPIKNEKGVITSWVGINLDIRRIKESEEDLRESERRFRHMADSAPVFIWISNTNKEYIWFNKPWLEFTGRILDEEQGKGWASNIHPDDAKSMWNAYIKACDERVPFRMEYRLKRNDGEYRWMLSSGLPMYNAKNVFTGYIGSAVDITDHKTALETLKDMDRRKDEFLAMLAHELRNPLAPISNGLQVMRIAAGSNPERLRQIQDVMERQVTHMVRLVDDLLDVSRITRGLIEIQEERLAIQSVVNNALEISRPLIDSKGHRLEVSMPEKMLYVRGDMTRLSQVVANLLNNAAKYTSPAGKIALKLTQKGENIILSIKDNGIGIPAEMLGSIFDIFVQVDTALDRSEGGLGIGLTLVRKLVGLHGGTIEVKSAGANKGSEFIVKLPLAEAE